MTKSSIIGLVSLSFIVVFRECLEVVSFLTPFMLSESVATLTGALAGTVSALILSYGIFVVGMKIRLRIFFYYTSLLLTLIAGGLAGYGVHELIEYYEYVGLKLGWLAEPAFDLGIPKEHPLHHKNVIGSVFAVMFGYTVKAEWVRVIVHFLYLVIMLLIVFRVYRKKE